MARIIAEDCISCGACEEECANGAISQGPDIYIVDPEKCTECVGNFDSPKCVEVCGVDASQPNPEYVESREELLAKWYRIHPGKTPHTS